MFFKSRFKPQNICDQKITFRLLIEEFYVFRTQQKTICGFASNYLKQKQFKFSL